MTAITVLDGEDGVRAAVGCDLGTTGWYDINDERLAEFADATGAPDAAYLAICLSNMFLPQIVEVRGFAIGINYGTDIVRFGSPLQAGDRARGQAALVDVTDVKGGIQTRMTIRIEVVPAGSGDNIGRQACTIEALSRWMGRDG